MLLARRRRVDRRRDDAEICGATAATTPEGRKTPTQCCSDNSLGRPRECTANPGYMLVQCACSCDSCDQVDYKVRCKLDPDAELAVPPGAMGATFERILSDFPQLQPTVLSRDPWLLQLDSFLDDEEAAAFVRQGSSKGFETSADTGKMRADGSFESIYSSHRTSQTAWMDTSPSLDDAVLNRVMARAANVTRVPTSHSEYVQVLQYGVGQYYQGHHDYIPAHAQLPCGPRVYTLFMYLSDVDEGGETAFERLKVSATPKRGARCCGRRRLTTGPPCRTCGPSTRRSRCARREARGEFVASPARLPRGAQEVQRVQRVRESTALVERVLVYGLAFTRGSCDPGRCGRAEQYARRHRVPSLA